MAIDDPNDIKTRHGWRASHGRPWLLSAALALSLCGCPRRFSAAASPITSKDANAQAAFQRGKHLFEQKKLAQAELALTAFIEKFPRDVLRPLAEVYRARLAFAQRRANDAAAILAPLIGDQAPESIRDIARYHAGLIDTHLGRYRQAQTLLSPLLKKADDATAPAILVALARAASALGDNTSAALHLGELHRRTDRPVERLYARRELQSLVTKLSERALRILYAKAGAWPSSLLLSLSSRRLTDAALRRGDLTEANAIRQASAAARSAYPLAGDDSRAGPTGPIGLLLPLSGPFRAAGRMALAGAAAAAGAFAKGAGLRLLIRDCAADAALAARELIEKEHVVALLGTFAASSASATATLARRHRIPFLSLSGATHGGAFTLRLLPRNAARVQSLAEAAIREGRGNRAAILSPQTRFGRAMARAFTQAIVKGGGAIVARQSYARGTTSFGAQAKALARTRFDALFVPDQARQVALLAPALAAAGIWPLPGGAPPPKGRQAILLLATADGLSAAFFARAHRYTQGALLAPGFFADPMAADGGSLIRHYHRTTGRAPTMIEAFAYDGVLVLKQHLKAGAHSRSTLLEALHQRRVIGMTGPLRFRTGRREARPLLYRVTKDGIRRR